MTRAAAVIDEERRELPLADAHIELREDGGAERFGGHAAVFDVRAAIGNPLKWGFYEEIAQGAFTKTLGESDARMLLDHNPFYVVSRASAGTLKLTQDARGLAVDSALDPDLSYVGDLVANIRNGNITGMSFGFYVVKDDWDKETVETNDGNKAEVEVRRIQEVRLVEVSAVTFPAYAETDAGLRAALRHRGDAEAIRRRGEFRPELLTLLDEIELEATDPKKPYGDVKYADPGYQKDGKKRYPIDTKDHCLAAWSYINQSKNAGKYTSEQLKAIKGRIKAALKKFKVNVDEKSLFSSDYLIEVLLGEREVISSTEEPGESTPPLCTDDVDPEPVESTRIGPSVHELAAVRLRALKAQLRRTA